MRRITPLEVCEETVGNGLAASMGLMPDPQKGGALDARHLSKGVLFH
jgi:hypothetical protein